MTTEKTLGQIGYEAGLAHKIDQVPWADCPRLHAVYDAAASVIRAEVIEECASLTVALAENMPELLLHLGAMSSAERRTVRAGLNLTAYRLRSLKEQPE